MPVTRRSAASVLLATLAASCESQTGYVGRVVDGGTGDCTSTELALARPSRVEPGQAWVGEFTFEGWFRLEVLPSTGTARLVGIDVSGACASATGAWDVWVEPDGSVHGTLGPTLTVNHLRGSVRPDRWFHLALQYEGAGVGALYLDGALAETYGAPGTTSPFVMGCAIAVGASDDGTARTADVDVASLRFRAGKHYVAPFVPENVLVRSPDTLYLFDPGVAATAPYVDGSTSWFAPGSSILPEGPGCTP